ncbi:hypothetical protein ABVT39_013594 [Epinephelus coioides]
MRRPESPPNPVPEDEPLSTDPANWPSVLTDRIRTQLVCRGPSEVPADFVFPRNEVDGRSCHHLYFKKTLVDGEKIPRSWLVYSEKNNSLFCVCCKLFSKRTINLTSSGLTDWKHASSLLTSHDNSPEYLNFMKVWKELAVRIKKGETIDNQEMALLEAEKMRWRAVLTHLTAIVQSLAVEAQSLLEEVGSYRFSICTVVWYDILSQTHHVSKLMQSPSMQVDVAVSLLKRIEKDLQSYRATGFVTAQMSAKDIYEEINVEAVLQQKRLRSTKRHFSYEASDEPLSDALKKLEVTFFNIVVDAATSAIQERFSTLQNVREKFGVLSNFKNLPDKELQKEWVKVLWHSAGFPAWRSFCPAEVLCSASISLTLAPKNIYICVNQENNLGVQCASKHNLLFTIISIGHFFIDNRSNKCILKLAPPKPAAISKYRKATRPKKCNTS